MSQTMPVQQPQQSQTVQFPERWEWEGEDLVLAYNPYDPERSQMCPDYSRLIGEWGDCQPVVLENKATGKQIQKYVMLARVKSPALPGAMIPEKRYRCFRLYDTYIAPQMVDWATLVFYEIKPRGGQDSGMSEGQRFLNALLTGHAAQEPEPPVDSQWAQDFAALQQQLTAQPVPAEMTQTAGEVNV